MNICQIDRCNNIVKAKGYCLYHYSQLPENKKKRDCKYRISSKARELNCINCNIKFIRKNHSNVCCSIVCTKQQSEISIIYKRKTRNVLFLKNQNKYIDWLGCSGSFLKQYLESKFQPGMTWENYKTKWHIDHIIPFSIINLKDRDELLKIINYKNLQPLWAIDNIKKSNKI